MNILVMLLALGVLMFVAHRGFSVIRFAPVAALPAGGKVEGACGDLAG